MTRPVHPEAPRLSIVMITYARDAILAEVLAHLAGQVGARTDVELILVDNNSDAGTRARLLDPFARARYLHSGWNKGVVARNDGIAVATGPVIVLLDDDVFVETPDFVDRFASLFAADATLGAVTISKHVRGETRRRTDIIPHTRKDVDLTKPFRTFRFVGGCVALRAAALAQVGAFLPDFFYGLEEVELSYRMIDGGWTMLYTPEIVAEELEHGGGRKPVKDSQTDRLANRYIMTWLHIPFPAIIINYLLFTPYLIYKVRGQVRVLPAIGRFLRWLAKRDRPRRKPLSPAALAYIRSCGGVSWR